jgi:hypothetical protein
MLLLDAGFTTGQLRALSSCLKISYRIDPLAVHIKDHLSKVHNLGVHSARPEPISYMIAVIL